MALGRQIPPQRLFARRRRRSPTNSAIPPRSTDGARHRCEGQPTGVACGLASGYDQITSASSSNALRDVEAQALLRHRARNVLTERSGQPVIPDHDGRGPPQRHRSNSSSNKMSPPRERRVRRADTRRPGRAHPRAAGAWASTLRTRGFEIRTFGGGRGTRTRPFVIEHLFVSEGGLEPPHPFGH